MARKKSRSRKSAPQSGGGEAWRIAGLVAAGLAIALIWIWIARQF